MKKFFKQYIGTKEFYKNTISIAVPVMIQTLITALVNLIDNVMIGSVGADAITAVAISNKYYMLFYATATGLAGSSSIYISQFFGANNKKNCQKILNITIVCSVILGSIFTLLIAIVPNQIVGIFTDTDSIMTLTVGYLKYAKFSYIPTALSLAVMICLRAVGINGVQMKIGIITVFTNTILNYALIYGNLGLPELGIEGAAIATLIARLVEVSIYITILVRHISFYKLDIKGMLHLDFSILKKVMIKCLPLTFNELIFSLGSTTIFISYMSVDESLVSAVSVADTIMSISFAIFAGLSSTIAILIGKTLGAGEIEEAKSNSGKLRLFGAMVGVVIGAIMFLIAPLIPNLYTNITPEIKETIVALVRTKGVLTPIYVINVCAFFTIRSGGDVVSTMIMDSGMLWLFMVIPSILISTYTDLPLVTVFIIIECTEFAKSIVSTYFIRKGKWAKNLAVKTSSDKP